MKKLFFSVLLLSVFSPAVLFAQNTVTIHQKDGQTVSYGFSVKPVITYTDNDLVITTENAEMQYPLLSVSLDHIRQDGVFCAMKTCNAFDGKQIAANA